MVGERGICGRDVVGGPEVEGEEDAGGRGGECVGECEGVEWG